MGALKEMVQFNNKSFQLFRKRNAIRHPAPFFLLQTLFILIETRIIQFSQRLNAIQGLAIYSYHIPILTKYGGMIGGMQRSKNIAILTAANREVR